MGGKPVLITRPINKREIVTMRHKPLIKAKPPDFPVIITYFLIKSLAC
jgi:hypothetical protein